MLFASQLILTDGTELCSTVGQGMDETSIWEGKRQSLHLQQVNHILVVERLVDELKELKASLERFKRTYVSWRHNLFILCLAYQLSPFNKFIPTIFDWGKTLPWRRREINKSTVAQSGWLTILRSWVQIPPGSSWDRFFLSWSLNTLTLLQYLALVASLASSACKHVRYCNREGVLKGLWVS